MAQAAALHPPAESPVRARTADVGAGVVAAVVAYLLAPGHPLGLLGGLPLDWASLGLLGIILIAVFGFGLPTSSRCTAVFAAVVVGATVLKLALWWAAPTYGLAASYYGRARLSGTPERSTELRGAAHTRVEASPGATFNLHFFNDVERFNFYDGDGPDRSTLPFAARWDGYLHVPVDRSYPFALVSAGDATIFLDGQPVLRVAGRDGRRADRVGVQLVAGSHPIRVELVHPGGVDPLLRLAADLGDGEGPLGPPSLTTHAADAGWLARDALLVWIARALDVLFMLGVLGLVAGLVRRHLAFLPGDADAHLGSSGDVSLGNPPVVRRPDVVQRPNVILSAAKDLRTSILRRSFAALRMTNSGLTERVRTTEQARAAAGTATMDRPTTGQPPRRDVPAASDDESIGPEGPSAWSRLERPLLAALLLGVLVHALITTADLYRQTVILEGGQDWLTYESYARDIVLNGPLMTLGKPLGQGRPFFFQPFYPYALALAHALTGEDLWGPIVLQLVGLGVAGVVLYFLTKRLFGVTAARAALGLFLVLRATQLDWVARKLLSENLYFVLLPAALLCLVRYVDERRRRDLIGAGLLFGVASITRAPTLLYVPLAAVIVAPLLRRSGTTWRGALVAFFTLGAVTAAVAALVPLRNYVVSGRPALVATNGGATMLLAHAPTDRVRLAGIDRDPLYNRLKLDRPTREVVEFIRQDPIGYAATLVPLGLYSIGVSGAIEGTADIAPDVLAISVLYVAALLLLPAARTLRAAPLHAFVVLHLAIMMTFLPYVYGYRQVLPMQLLMLVFGGALLAHLLGRIAARRAARLAHLPPQVPRAGADPISTTT